MHRERIIERDDLMSQWDWEDNEIKGLDPNKLTVGSVKKASWICPKVTCKYGCPHKWEATPNHRDHGRGCPFCISGGSAKRFCIHASLAFQYPEIAKEWNYEKNKKIKWKDHDGNLTYKGPEDYLPMSNEKVHWICLKSECGCPHEWETTINSRINLDSGCPYCASSGSNKLCIHQSLSYKYPEIAKEWDYEKNKIVKHKNADGTVTYKGPEDYLPSSNVKVHWRCQNSKCGCPHEWIASLNSRLKGGCPYCCSGGPNKKFCQHASFGEMYPKIASEWNYEKNKKVKSIDENGNEIFYGPNDYLPSSSEKVHWVCLKAACGCKHEWKTGINNRVNGMTNCPFCAGRKVCIHTSFGTFFPHLLEEWNYDKNEKTPYEYSPSSPKKVSWICKKNSRHEWVTAISDRRLGSGCPLCFKKTETLVFEYLSELYSEMKIINQKRFKGFVADSQKPYSFDFYIPRLKVIIELDGDQHFFQVSNWQAPETTLKVDVIKMKYVLEKGIRIFRIYQPDVLKSDKWKKDLEIFIESDDKIAYSCSIPDLYNKHVDLLQRS